jgi:hypothetical protein
VVSPVLASPDDLSVCIPLRLETVRRAPLRRFIVGERGG